MKNKKGFTLIELLAIIVILAIIAVITVPIILNIIENSKKGAATDSAYGFKDAVNKAYVTKLSGDSDYSITDNTYTVEELKTQIDLSLSGKEPASNSWVKIQENNVTEGCLQYDEFKVELSDGKVTNTEKGECSLSVPTIASCPDCVFAFYTTPKKYGENGDTLTEYTNDYTTLNKNYFLGHILENGKIIRAFTCGIHINGTPYCIEGTIDGSKNTENRTFLINSVFNGNGNGHCDPITTGEFECYDETENNSVTSRTGSAANGYVYTGSDFSFEDWWEHKCEIWEGNMYCS